MTNEYLKAKVEAYKEAAAFCNGTPGLVLNACNAMEFEKRARELLDMQV